MIITQSPKVEQLIQFAKRAARSKAPVLLTGESGTGKELFAQLIHQSSPRSDQPFIPVNCAAIAENLFESELFGHEKGAFSGAIGTREGRFEIARGGTLFLDEVGEIPLPLQSKLLRVLESKRFERVGSSLSLEHDVRIVAATNRDLKQAVEQGEFRLDLLHRINVLNIDIPPLRKRIADIPTLALHFVEMFRSESELKIEGFDSSAMKALAHYDWPGNIRELRNVIHRACVLTDSPRITKEYLGLEESEPEKKEEPSLPNQWLHTNLEEVERQIIIAAIKAFGNRQVVAEKLGISPRTLTNKIRRYRECNEPNGTAASNAATGNEAA
ncbi:sigma-54 dependent transcriptional regulator [Stieleria sp. JC731]|uniref:sigma-54 interaction domain-containing protein n=1 Tax=Pirellulaceae TaxID=2691357 RepID=UPI001E2EFB1F|nr:sigma-54 dependent transcriptional regulator [Stieleria sp. JC731]MCC9602048.1 sigma-54 dependent transcriptional regulator [Stieleria sp. JC731]